MDLDGEVEKHGIRFACDPMDVVRDRIPPRSDHIYLVIGCDERRDHSSCLCPCLFSASFGRYPHFLAVDLVVGLLISGFLLSNS